MAAHQRQAEHLTLADCHLPSLLDSLITSFPSICPSQIRIINQVKTADQSTIKTSRHRYKLQVTTGSQNISIFGPGLLIMGWLILILEPETGSIPSDPFLVGDHRHVDRAEPCNDVVFRGEYCAFDNPGQLSCKFLAQAGWLRWVRSPSFILCKYWECMTEGDIFDQ